MEEQLRAYAESRRLEAPSSFELDGPARRRLHEEVRSVYLSDPLPRKGGVSGWFWARIAFVGASAALVLFVSVQFLSDPQPVQFAHNKGVASDQARSRVAETAAEEVARSPGTAPLGVTRSAEMPSDAGAVRTTPELFAVNDAEPPAMDLAEAGELPSPGGLDSQPVAQDAYAFGVAESTREPRVETLTQGQTFHQIQRYRRNPNSPMPPQVLQSFRWIREGDAVTIVDSDGSVYRGQMGANQSATQVLPRRFAVQASRKTSAPEPSRLQLQSLHTGLDGAADGERFAVSGTNRTLNLMVEFEGVLGSLAAAPQTSTRNTSATGMGQAAPGDTAIQIQGQAQVGPSTRLGILAVPRVE